MNIKETNVEKIIEALVERIKALETEVWWREEQIAKLKAELEAKGGVKNG